MTRTLIVPLIIVMGFALGAAALVVTAPELEPNTPEPLAMTVRVRDVLPKPVTLSVHSQGSVTPSTETQLIPEVSGRVVWMSPQLVAGGYFEQGDVLLRIDPEDYSTTSERAAASRARAQAELEHARFEHERLASLAERQLVSRSQLESALRAWRVAEAALTEANATLDQARQDLGRTELRAPFTGLVRSESIDIGQFVSRGSSIARIYASDEVEIRLPVSDRQLAFLDLPFGHRGALSASAQAEVLLTTEYAGRALAWNGRIVRTEAAIDASSRMLYLVASVPAGAGDVPLSVGLFVNAEIKGRQADNVVVMPRTALRNNNQVLVVDEENRLRLRNVDLLRIYQNDLLISAGLEAGERVCVSTVQTVIDGMPVVPVADDTLTTANAAGAAPTAG